MYHLSKNIVLVALAAVVQGLNSANATTVVLTEVKAELQYHVLSSPDKIWLSAEVEESFNKIQPIERELGLIEMVTIEGEEPILVL